jgi:CRP/FNR family transcriptional regulator
MSIKADINPACAFCEGRKDSWFKDLDNQKIEEMSLHKSCIKYKKGQNIFYEGTRPMGLFCINSGKVKVYKNSPQGKEYIYRIAKPGEFLGYRALLSEEYYAGTATVLEDANICFIPKDYFFNVLQKDPTFMRKMVKAISHEMGVLETKLAELAQKSVRERLAGTLLMLKDTYGIEGEGNALIDIALSREDLANIVGTATETVIRLLSEFKGDGLISFEGKRIRVLEPRKLARQADLLA